MLQSDLSGWPGIAGGSLGFSKKEWITLFTSTAMTPKPVASVARDLEAADGHVGALVDMLLQHLFVIHLVDVIAGEQHDELAARSSR